MKYLIIIIFLLFSVQSYAQSVSMKKEMQKEIVFPPLDSSKIVPMPFYSMRKNVLPPNEQKDTRYDSTRIEKPNINKKDEDN